MQKMLRWINGHLVIIYNHLISQKCINRNTSLMRRLRAILYHNICYECHASFGHKNKDRLFYVIRCPQSEMGLFASINYVFYHLEKALNLNAEPVVDWEFYPNSYYTYDDKIGKENAWEYFFNQITNISLEEVYKSYHVIMSSGEWDVSSSDIYQGESEDKHKTFCQYIVPNKKTQDAINLTKENLQFAGKRILGVKCRGSDFIATKPDFHAIVPDNNMTISVIEEKISEWGGFDKIFLSTEDQSILDRMRQHFGDKLLYVEADRITLESSKWLSDVYDQMPRECNKEKNMRDYLIETYLLASCDALIAPRVGGTVGALRIKGKYDFTHFFQLGLYPAKTS